MKNGISFFRFVAWLYSKYRIFQSSTYVQETFLFWNKNFIWIYQTRTIRIPTLTHIDGQQNILKYRYDRQPYKMALELITQ